MKIGIIVYSETGHTLEVADLLQEKLIAAGHYAEIVRIRADKRRMKLEEAPPAEGYDALVLASPVHAFTLSQPMKLYLKTLPSLKGRRVGIYVTQQLKRPFFGGNRALRHMRKQLEKAQADVVSGGIVHWNAKEREEQKARVVESLIP